MFELKWEKRALQELNKFEGFIARRILKKINKLKENPFSKDVKRLQNSGYFRLRVGDYRILFTIKEEIIEIWKIGHRKNIYK